ncbi:hypothetical protein HDU67_003037 [Dinochytrium kinnereticum]|nr:hypothetical protein HDU67_003037 [Dinochytrium kinnereticum]
MSLPTTTPLRHRGVSLLPTTSRKRKMEQHPTEKLEAIPRSLPRSFSELDEDVVQQKPYQEEAVVNTVRVFLRCRPSPPGRRFITRTSDREVCFSQGAASTKSMDRDVLRQEFFQFDHVFGEHSTQDEVFRLTAVPLVDRMFGQDCNELLMAYGPSGSGKTFTLGITGILGLSLQLIFQKLANVQTKIPVRCRGWDEVVLDENSTSSAAASSSLLDVEPKNAEYALFMSFMEIYNDRCRDLLDKGPIPKYRKIINPLSYDMDDVQVTDLDSAKAFVATAVANRSVSGTKVNNASSRGHMITSLKLIRISRSLDGTKRSYQNLSISRLAICDLAGIENSKQTEAEGFQLAEAGKINESLFALGQCISAMVRLDLISKMQDSQKKQKELETFLLHVNPVNEDQTKYVLQQGKNMCRIASSEIVNTKKRKIETGSKLLFDAVVQKALKQSQLDEAERDIQYLLAERDNALASSQNTLGEVENLRNENSQLREILRKALEHAISIQNQAKEDRLHLIEVFEDRLKRAREEDEVEADRAIERKLEIANLSSTKVDEIESELAEQMRVIQQLQLKLEEASVKVPIFDICTQTEDTETADFGIQTISEPTIHLSSQFSQTEQAITSNASTQSPPIARSDSAIQVSEPIKTLCEMAVQADITPSIVKVTHSEEGTKTLAEECATHVGDNCFELDIQIESRKRARKPSEEEIPEVSEKLAKVKRAVRPRKKIPEPIVELIEPQPARLPLQEVSPDSNIVLANEVGPGTPKAKDSPLPVPKRRKLRSQKAVQPAENSPMKLSVYQDIASRAIKSRNML